VSCLATSSVLKQNTATPPPLTQALMGSTESLGAVPEDSGKMTVLALARVVVQPATLSSSVMR
jgi:hypothetical protein